MSFKRLESIDFLRGAAATAVVCYHAAEYSNIQLVEGWFWFFKYVFGWGFLGVPLFFVISGFCIHLKWAKKARENSDARNLKIDFLAFWKRRFWRLYPSYFVALCVSMSLLFIAYLMGVDGPGFRMYPGSSKLQWMFYDFLAHTFMLHGFYPAFDKNGGNGAFWSLAREEYLYLLYFVFLAFRRKIGLIKTNGFVLAVSLLFPVIASTFILPDSRWFDIIITSALALWFQWTLGTIAVESYLGLVKLPRWTRSGVAIIFWAALGFLSSYGNAWFLGNCLWGMCFFTLVNYCVSRETQIREMDFVKKSVSYKYFVWVGTWSYSLYLVHAPIQRIVRYILETHTLALNPTFFNVLTFVVLVIASFIAGRFFFDTVEKRFIIRTGVID